MSADAAPEDKGQLFTLATRPKPEPHKWGEIVPRKPNETPTGREQFERECTRCPLVKITIVRSSLPRAYRFGKDGVQFYPEVEPVCVAVVGEAKP